MLAASGLNQYYGGSHILRDVAFALVRGPLTGLPIPAYSEIAIEGEMFPGDDLPEGPFGEWPGYYASATRPEPVVRIKALYYRNSPILCGEPPLRPSAGQGFHRSIQRSALIWNALRNTSVHEIVPHVPPP